MLYRMLTILVVCAALPASATSSSKATTHGPADMLVQTSWLAAHLADKNLVILHVGTDRNSYDAAHIPGARFLALSEIAVTRNGIPNELPPVNDLKDDVRATGCWGPFPCRALRRYARLVCGAGILYTRLPWPRKQHRITRRRTGEVVQRIRRCEDHSRQRR